TVSGFQTFAWTVMNGRPYFVPGDGPANLAVLREHGIRAIKTSPARLENLVDAAEAEGVVPGDLAVEVVQVAGSLLTPSVARRAEGVFGCTPLYLYGSTEVGTVTRGVFDRLAPNAVGSVVDGSEVQVVDETGAPTPAGELGTIRYRAPFTPDHYWRAGPEANSSFRHGWFYPGDLGVLDADGRLLISGRADDLVNAGGAKFNLAELDLWMRELDLFTDCASFQFRDATGATSIGIAFQSRHPADPAIVLERVRALLPNLEIKALLRVDGIPRNHLGKVVRTSLAELMTGDKQ
ncbi:MAG: AMP-binding protein, partial [Rhodoglobus sp.]